MSRRVRESLRTDRREASRAWWEASSAVAEELQKHVRSQQMTMGGDLAENRRQRSRSQRRVPWNRDVVLAALLRGEAKMAACLARDRGAEGSEGPREIVAREIARQPQVAITTSRTK